MSRVELPAKGVGSTVAYLFDCTSYLQVGETVASASFSITPWWGVDPNSSAMLVGSPTVTSSGPVVQRVGGGVLGVIYRITCSAQTVLASANYQLLTLEGFIAVVPDV